MIHDPEKQAAYWTAVSADPPDLKAAAANMAFAGRTEPAEVDADILRAKKFKTMWSKREAERQAAKT